MPTVPENELKLEHLIGISQYSMPEMKFVDILLDIITICVISDMSLTKSCQKIIILKTCIRTWNKLVDAIFEAIWVGRAVLKYYRR